tara:strand:+ start:356 stop:658 length:303 start_codon:yes stop_codon:yes gene_type:complete
MIKLKKLINESNVWDRKFGEPLPTLKNVVEKHQETVNEEDKGESLWTWIYKGLLSGFKKAEKKGTVTLDEVARGVAFLIKTEFGAGAKRDLIKAINKHVK